MTVFFWLRVKIIASLLALMVAIHLVNLLLDGSLNQFGIIPRQKDAWFHVFSSPFIHGSNTHLLNNLISLGLFSAICLLRPVGYFLLASLFIIVVGGGMVWAFGRDAYHIGASGWIFGLWGLSIMTAWFDKSIKNLLIAFFVIIFYGGMAYGVLPNQPGVSFEGHLFGVVAGVLFAALSSKWKLANSNSSSNNSDRFKIN